MRGRCAALKVASVLGTLRARRPWPQRLQFGRPSGPAAALQPRRARLLSFLAPQARSARPPCPPLSAALRACSARVPVAGQIDPPTLSMVFSPNTSPLAGREGSQLTGARIGERLQVGGWVGGWVGAGGRGAGGALEWARRRWNARGLRGGGAIGRSGPGACNQLQCSGCSVAPHPPYPPCRRRPRPTSACGCCLWRGLAARALRCRPAASCSWGCS